MGRRRGAVRQEHPRPLTKIELIHSEFAGKVPHPELHGGKKPKDTWAQLEDSGLSFLEFVEKHTSSTRKAIYSPTSIRVMNFAQKLFQASQLSELEDMAERVKKLLGQIDMRFVEGLR